MSNIIDDSNNEITLSPTDTIIDGKGGDDTLVVNGESRDYLLERIDDTTFRLTSLTPDAALRQVTLKNIESIRFNNETLIPANRVANILSGTGGADTLDATTATDATQNSPFVFQGGAGDDIIVGSVSSSDVADFSGNASDYWISLTNDGRYSVLDLRRTGSDGQDILSDVEYLRFADKIIYLPTANVQNRSIRLGTDASENLRGTAGQDLFFGKGGNDRIVANDWGGQDIAVYSGNINQYAITRNSNGSYTVIDMRDGSPDGTDILFGVTTFRFADGVFKNPTNQTSVINTTITGTSGKDKLSATDTSGNTALIGGAGNDSLTGKDGNDQLFGGDGADIIKAGAGADLTDILYQVE